MDLLDFLFCTGPSDRTQLALGEIYCNEGCDIEVNLTVLAESVISGV